MNNRDESIIRAVLQVLDLLDGDASETIVHAEVNLRVKPNALLMELDRGLGHCEARRWIVGVRPELGATKWSLTDKGRAALANMR